MLLKTNENVRFGGENEPGDLKRFVSSGIGSKSTPVLAPIRTHAKAETKRKNLTASFAIA
jgi:hypothetical protein